MGATTLPDDIEATIREITSGRCAWHDRDPDHGTEKLVALSNSTGDSDEDVATGCASA